MSDYADHIWRYLLDRIRNPIAVAGIMGNLKAESALRPDNVQNSFEARYGNDKTYTERVDSGVYGREKFSRDSAGYGLAQWTHWSRKAALWDHLKGKGLSIADLEGQLDFIIIEMEASGLLAKLERMTDVTDATALVLRSYEKPADQSAAAVERRAKNAREYLAAFGAPDLDKKRSISEALEHLDQVRRILEGL